MSKSRNSSVELLRILSMLFIICSHFCVHGSFETQEMSFSINKMVLQIGVLGNLGVDVFVMISGYFLSQTDFRISRIVKVMLQVSFYSISIFFILVGLKIVPFSIKAAIKSIFPVLFNQYWFATTYVVVCFFSPFMNQFLNCLSKRKYLLYLGTIVIIWSVLPTFTAQSLASNEFCQFVMFYSVGAYVRKYPSFHFATKNRYWIVGISAFLLVLSTVFFNLLAINFPVFNHGTYFYSRNSILIVTLSYGLLLVFTNMKSISSMFINSIASTVFGIYLIHDNKYLRPVIWEGILNVNEYKESPYLILYLLGCVMLVFTVCAIIDLIRQKLIEKPVLRLIDPLIKWLNKKIYIIDKNELQNN